jgi:hypothetical protein
MNKTVSSAAKPANNSAGATSGNPNSNIFTQLGEALKNLFGGGNKK